MRLRRPRREVVLPAMAGAALVAFIGAIGAGAVALPQHSVSVLDGRRLATFPDPSASSLEDGHWMKGAESWLDDHIPARQRWLEMHAAVVTRGMRDPVINNVYVGEPHGILLENIVRLHVPKRLPRDAATFSKEVRATGTPILWVYVPHKEEVFADQLPKAWPNYLAKTRPQVLKAFRAAGPTLDLTATLSNPQHRDEYFWRTDHHWTPAGVNAALAAITKKAASLGVRIPPDNRTYTRETFPYFYGSEGRKVTAGAVTHPEHFHALVPDHWRARSCAHGRCDQPTFVTSNAKAPNKYANRYLAFLGGDLGYQRIENHDPHAKGKIILLKDSMGDALATYLAERVRTLITIDERHYSGKDIAKVVADEHPDLVMVMHNQVSLLGNRQFSSQTWVDMKAAIERRSHVHGGDG